MRRAYPACGVASNRLRIRKSCPLPGDRPNASVDWGTTVEEQIEGEPHSRRLARERPDPSLKVGSDDVVPDDENDDERASADEIDADDAGVGRLMNDQAIEPGDQAPDTDVINVGADGGGLSAEERAMHVQPG